MGERFLYGDSQPFPNGYDFLTELRQLVDAASRALALAHEADSLEEGLGERAQVHLQAIESLAWFFDGLSELITDRIARAHAPQLVAPYGRELLQQVELIGTRAKSSRAHELDAAQVEVASHIRDLRADLKGVVSSYLLTDPLPVASWALSMTLTGETPQGQVVLAHPGELTTSFAVDVAGDGTWGKPRKLGEIHEGLALQVGWKKAFLRSSLHPDVAALDDLTIAAVELGPDSMEVRLRKKPDAPRDAFVITLDPDPTGGPVAKVTRLDDKKGDSDAPHTSQGEDRDRVLELAASLRRHAKPLLERKRRLVYAQLDGHDVFERGLVRALFERIADRLAPIASAVSAHSPNPSELSLKVERDGGRREELYLRKEELVKMVAPLPPEAQQLFHRLSFLPPPKASPSAPPPPKHRL